MTNFIMICSSIGLSYCLTSFLPLLSFIFNLKLINNTDIKMLNLLNQIFLVCLFHIIFKILIEFYQKKIFIKIIINLLSDILIHVPFFMFFALLFGAPLNNFIIYKDDHLLKQQDNLTNIGTFIWYITYTILYLYINLIYI